ncbi:MAG: hypothetical protein ACXV76_12930 [Halobacteriota archaeon]
MKREYLALLAVFVALIALSLWIAAQTNLPDIESRITSAGNASHEGNDGIIEGGGFLPYLVVTGLLLVVGVVLYWILGKRRAR